MPLRNESGRSPSRCVFVGIENENAEYRKSAKNKSSLNPEELDKDICSRSNYQEGIRG